MRARTSEDFSVSQRGTSSPVGVGRPSGMVALAPARTARPSKAATPPMRRERLWKRLRDLLDTGIDPSHSGSPMRRP